MTTAPAIIDDLQFTVTRTVLIRASRQRVWDCLTSPDHLARWFGQSADFPNGITEGATGTLGWTAHGDFPARIERFDPQAAFAFTWGTPGEEIRADNATTANFTLADEGDAIALTVTETGFDSLGEQTHRRAAMEDNAQGWTEELDEFVAYVEDTGETPPASAEADIDAGTITRSVRIDADREHVWEMIITPQHIEAWWGHPARFPDGIVPGSLGIFEWPAGNMEFPVRIDVVRECTRFDLTWGNGEEIRPESSTTVRFDLRDDAGGTLVTVTESGFADWPDGAARRAQMEENVTGWNQVLDSLAAYATTKAA